MCHATRFRNVSKEYLDAAAVFIANRKNKNRLDAGKAHEWMKAETYLMLQGENDMSEMKTTFLEEFHAFIQCHNRAIPYLNRCRIVAESYAYCRDILDAELWKGASTWYADHEECEEVLEIFEGWLSTLKSLVKWLLKRDGFCNKMNEYCSESDSESEDCSESDSDTE